jgi:cell division protein FtsB
MNKAANTYWTDTRLAAQRPTARALPLTTQVGELSRELVGTRTEVRRRGGLIPSWTIFCMIMLATFALCVTVTMRAHAEMRAAAQQHEQMSSTNEALRDTNDSLRREVQRLRSDPHAIEAAARTRLNMVRANEIVVPVE